MLHINSLNKFILHRYLPGMNVFKRAIPSFRKCMYSFICNYLVNTFYERNIYSGRKFSYANIYISLKAN